MIFLLKLLIFFIKISCINNNPPTFYSIFVQKVEGGFYDGINVINYFLIKLYSKSI